MPAFYPFDLIVSPTAIFVKPASRLRLEWDPTGLQLETYCSAHKLMLNQIIQQQVSVSVGRPSSCVQSNLSIEWHFIGVINASKVLDFSGARQSIDAFRVSLLANFQGRINE